MLTSIRILSLSIASLAMMYVSVHASESYASSHPMDGLQLKMSYCMEMQRAENRSPEDVGCKVGWGDGKMGVKKDIVKQLVARMNKNKHSYEYKQLVSSSGLHLMFVDESLGSRGKAVVWQSTKGSVSYKFEREE